jgi:hypothetical protein
MGWTIYPSYKFGNFKPISNIKILRNVTVSPKNLSIIIKEIGNFAIHR